MLLFPQVGIKDVQLRAPTENIVMQSIQNELVLVNLASGIYYFLTGSAAVIFSALDAGCPQENLMGQLSEYYGSDVSTAKCDIDSFVGQLIKESLLVEGVGGADLAVGDFLSLPFVAPVLNKCEDLQDLLLIDPVVSRASFDGRTGSN